MADIFISYSSRDREQAELLAELLASAGLSVWIDQSGIGAATSWSSEIAEALEGCQAFLLLMSSNSLASKNVLKELSLAAEADKLIVPIAIEEVPIPTSFKYHLAGLQRTPFSDLDSVLRVLEPYRNREVPPPSVPVFPALASDDIRMAVLPFEDQSPQHDNEWFSDGLTDELISALGKVEKIFIVDGQSSRIYKAAKLPAKTIASQLRVRYLVRGAVRKAGEKIRIHAALIDTSNGATLWDEKFSGTMEDIFEIQEKTAFDIAQGLKLKLTKEEVAEIEDRGTENAEAYELYLKAYATNGDAKEDHAHSMEWIRQAVALDPTFAKAYALMAVRYANYFRRYGQKSETLELQRQAAERAQALAPEAPSTYNALANFYNINGEKEKAIETARKIIQKTPKQPLGYSVTGFMCIDSGTLSEAATLFEQALAINPGLLRERGNLMACYYHLGDKQTFKNTVIGSVPYYEQYLVLHPDDQSIRVQLMIALESIDRHDLANREAERLLAMPEVFGNTYYQISSVYARQGHVDKAIELLKKAAEKGQVIIQELRIDKDFFGNLQVLPHFEQLVSELEGIAAKASQPHSVDHITSAIE